VKSCGPLRLFRWLSTGNCRLWQTLTDSDRLARHMKSVDTFKIVNTYQHSSSHPISSSSTTYHVPVDSKQTEVHPPWELGWWGNSELYTPKKLWLKRPLQLCCIRLLRCRPSTSHHKSRQWYISGTSCHRGPWGDLGTNPPKSYLG